MHRVLYTWTYYSYRDICFCKGVYINVFAIFHPLGYLPLLYIHYMVHCLRLCLTLYLFICYFLFFFKSFTTNTLSYIIYSIIIYLFVIYNYLYQYIKQINKRGSYLAFILISVFWALTPLKRYTYITGTHRIVLQWCAHRCACCMDISFRYNTMISWSNINNDFIRNNVLFYKKIK